MQRKATAVLLYADSETNADMLYRTGIFVPDPFVYFQIGGQSSIIVSDLEYWRAKKYALVDHVLSQQDLERRVHSTTHRPVRIADILAYIFRTKGIKRISVPKTFPLGLANGLQKAGLKITCGPDPFFPARACKSTLEIKHIKDALRAAEHAMDTAIGILREARIARKRKHALLYGGEVLTAEKLKALIHRAVMERNCVATHTIVSCGRQSYNPHEEGNGVLYAHRPIIIDIFPRSNKTGYYGDITRTVVKGNPPEWIERAYEAVREAQQLALHHIRDGAQGQHIHQRIVSFFEQNGFPTKKVGERMVGFFHGTGHGLGLALHEYPWIGHKPCVLKTGHVVTVEPGLYCPEIGGVRLEDVVVVTEQGARVLTRFPKKLVV